MSRIEPPATDTRALYKAHPHLREIDQLWGTADGRALLLSLMSETRGDQREGFSQEHASTLLKLLIEHDRRFPRFDDSNGGAWWLGLDRAGKQGF